jgi:hypothetical protein
MTKLADDNHMEMENSPGALTKLLDCGFKINETKIT